MRISTILITAILFLTFMACKQSEQIRSDSLKTDIDKQRANAEFMTRAEFEHQKFPAHVQFRINQNDPAANSSVIRDQMQFIELSGLPTIYNMLDWVNAKTAEETKDLYQNYKNKNSSHEYLNVFKQYESWLLLTRFGILAGTDAESLDLAKMLTVDLVTTQYKGYGLLYYALKHLKDNAALSADNIRVYKAAILQYSRTSTPAKTTADTSIISQIERQRGKSLPPEFRQAMLGYLDNSSREANTYLPMIEKL